MTAKENISVEVIYAKPESQKAISVSLLMGSNAKEAIIKSGILDMNPEIDLSVNKVGVFGRVIKKVEDHILLDRDRVEIYRPLIKEKTKKS